MRIPLDLDADPQVAALARRAAGAALTAAPYDVDGATVELVVSEMVTNAIRHAGTRSTLEICVEPEHVRIEIRDGDERVPEVHLPDAEAEHGRGMAVVAGLADRWGVDVLPGVGKLVWAEIDASPPPRR